MLVGRSGVMQVETLIAIYIAGYTVWSIAGVVNDIRSQYSLWVVALNIFVSVAALTGMYFYLSHTATGSTLQVWKAVFFAVAIGEAALIGIDAYDSLKESDWTTVAAGSVIAVVLAAPAMVLNYMVAFGPD